ncbi:lysylphosphatidylglycerol synthase transmembrane domain-containing protein [Halocatena salina]|uniref:Flippase-like domain-containing protein n=1 Tax=Halocatena salina TaxID=2934340 RepID=A0A8U0A1C9_9EURY|nr:lysylphosphatidylglycerol synthase transmembrane domain-containing protein [Halocatena salina]UPM42981.1 flippase-like domain-containing protein [Halocatena salina]
MGLISGSSYRWLLKLFQYALGGAALLWLVVNAEWERVLTVIDGIHYGVVAVILAASVAETLCRFSMWHVLLNGVSTTPFSTAARTTLITNFVNQILPSRLSGRSIAPLVLRHYTRYDWSEVVTIAGVHTALYAVCNGFVAAIGLAFFLPEFSPGLLIVLAGSIALYLFVGVGSLLAGWQFDSVTQIIGNVRSRLERIPLVSGGFSAVAGRLPSFSDGVADVFDTLLTDHRVIGLYTGGWIASRMVFPGLRVGLLLDALNVGFSPVMLPVVLVTAYSVTLLPITPGGIGVAEASATLVFGALGVAEPIIAPVILVDRFLSVYLPSLAGWYPVTRLDLTAIAAGEQ